MENCNLTEALNKYPHEAATVQTFPKNQKLIHAHPYFNLGRLHAGDFSFIPLLPDAPILSAAFPICRD